MVFSYKPSLSWSPSTLSSSHKNPKKKKFKPNILVHLFFRGLSTKFSFSPSIFRKTKPLKFPFFFLLLKVLLFLREMCPLRFILVFFSAVLAGYFAWRTVRSSPEIELASDIDSAMEEKSSSKKEDFDFKKVYPQNHVFTMVHDSYPFILLVLLPFFFFLQIMFKFVLEM